MPAASMSDPHELLERMLTGHGLERVIAWGRAMSLGFGGMTVIDRCNPDAGAFGWTVHTFRRHLFATDNPDTIARRGRLLHTPDNVEFGSLDDVDAGPALGATR